MFWVGKEGLDVGLFVNFGSIILGYYLKMDGWLCGVGVVVDGGRGGSGGWEV